MHKFMRAIGFSQYNDRKKIKELIRNIVLNSEERSYTLNEENIMLGEFCKSFAEDIGIAVCGEFDEEDKFTYEYYYPYLRGRGITSTEDVSVERHAAKESYAGVCDDVNVGITLIFYLQNMIPYINERYGGRLPVRGTTLTLSALSTSGTVMMPIRKDEFQRSQVKKESVNRSKLIVAARSGDEEAMERLTLEDMDIYSTISKKILKEDVYSIVDTHFMPYGVECDHYSVLGEITAVEERTNTLTGEELYLLTIFCNELTFDVIINKIDLFGEPQVGRRFKGFIWLQGKINLLK